MFAVNFSYQFCKNMDVERNSKNFYLWTIRPDEVRLQRFDTPSCDAMINFYFTTATANKDREIQWEILVQKTPTWRCLAIDYRRMSWCWKLSVISFDGCYWQSNSPFLLFHMGWFMIRRIKKLMRTYDFLMNAGILWQCISWPAGLNLCNGLK